MAEARWPRSARVVCPGLVLAGETPARQAQMVAGKILEAAQSPLAPHAHQRLAQGDTSVTSTRRQSRAGTPAVPHQWPASWGETCCPAKKRPSTMQRPTANALYRSVPQFGTMYKRHRRACCYLKHALEGTRARKTPEGPCRKGARCSTWPMRRHETSWATRELSWLSPEPGQPDGNTLLPTVTPSIPRHR